MLSLYYYLWNTHFHSRGKISSPLEKRLYFFFFKLGSSLSTTTFFLLFISACSPLRELWPCKNPVNYNHLTVMQILNLKKSCPVSILEDCTDKKKKKKTNQILVVCGEHWVRPINLNCCLSFGPGRTVNAARMQEPIYKAWCNGWSARGGSPFFSLILYWDFKTLL